MGWYTSQKYVEVWTPSIRTQAYLEIGNYRGNYSWPLNNMELNLLLNISIFSFWSNYTWKFFWINILFIFSFYRSLHWVRVCVQLEITITEIKGTRVWVLILTELFTEVGWVIYEFLHFLRQVPVHRFSTAGSGDSTSNSYTVQKSTIVKMRSY